MRPVSAKRAREISKRRAMLKRSHGPERCHWPDGCPDAADDPHEILSRARGGSIVDPDNVVPLCRRHHDLITQNPALGVNVGLVRSQNVSESFTLGAMPSPRKPIAIRVSAEADDWIEKAAGKHGVSRSVVTRAMLSVATAHPDEVDRKIDAIAEVDRHARPTKGPNR